MDKAKEIICVDVSAVECNIETPCIICGEGVPAFGHSYGGYVPKVCENCKNAVMKVRDFLRQEHT